jgi:hypothetical protein
MDAVMKLTSQLGSFLLLKALVATIPDRGHTL